MPHRGRHSSFLRTVIRHFMLGGVLVASLRTLKIEVTSPVGDFFETIHIVIMMCRRVDTVGGSELV